MEVIHSAIGDLGVNASDLPLGLGPVLRTERHSSQPSLVSGQLGRIFARMTRIVGFISPVRHEQVFDAKVDDNGIRRDTQQRRGELAPARDKVTSCRVLGDRQGAGR